MSVIKRLICAMAFDLTLGLSLFVKAASIIMKFVDAVMTNNIALLP